MAKSAFKLDHPLERMQAESAQIREKYPERIPVIVERAERSDVPDVDKKKFRQVGLGATKLRPGTEFNPAKSFRAIEDQSLASNSCFLPEDVVTDQILSRLPVKSLMRFKIVCKRWHALITTPSFIASHLKYIGTPNRLVRWNAKNDDLIVGDDAFHVFSEFGFARNFQPVNLNFGFDRKPDFVLGPCDGIYCLYWRAYDELSYKAGITVAKFERLPTIALWNPATRSFSILPMSKVDFPPYRRVTYCMVGFGCDLITKSIKVVKVSCLIHPVIPIPPYMNHAEVYDLVSGSWRVLPLDGILQKVIVDDSLMRSMYTKNDGVFHWHTRLMGCSKFLGDQIVLSFDMSTELFHVTLLPEKYRGFHQLLRFCWKDSSFALRRDSLAFICSFFHKEKNYTTVEAWVMEKDLDCVVEAGKSSSSYKWSHELTVELPFPGPCIISKGFWNGNELLIWKDFDALKKGSGRSPFLYDIVTKQARDLEISGELNFIYRESLVSVREDVGMTDNLPYC